MRVGAPWAFGRKRGARRLRRIRDNQRGSGGERARRSQPSLSAETTPAALRGPEHLICRDRVAELDAHSACGTP